MALTNSQYESIMRDYELIRDANRHLSEARREEIYTAIPEYRELESSVASLSVSAAKDLLDGVEDARTRLHGALNKIRNRQQELLSAAGYPADYLKPIYNCAYCQDTGYLPSENGAKQKCSCFRRREISLLYAQSNIQDMISRENFSTLSYEYYQGEDLQHFQSAVRLSKNFVENFKEDYHNIIFYGTVGTGKSFLSGCIAKELLNQGFSVIYFSAAGLFETLARYSFDYTEKENLQDFCEDLYNCDLLIIDDLGTEVTNSFVTSQLFSCLNERQLRRRASIISTNLNLEELRDRYSDRIFSRITSNFFLCKLTGPDIRIYRKRLATNKELQ
ncbi:MAG: ATP-binding protein [Acetatifactor sp.]